jgi:MFS superfamily sulfate permease-like transporter
MNSKIVFADLRSGIVVFLVAMPLCLGIAMACQLPLFSGIIAGVVGGLIVTLFSGAKYSVSGPATGLTAIIISSVNELGSFQLFLAAVVVAGLVQSVFGLIKVGGIGNYIPNAVIKGMLAGIGIILIIKQIPHLVGYDADPEGDMEFWQSDGHNSFSDLFYMINYITPGPMLIGIISFVIYFITKMKFYRETKFLSVIPGPLAVVVVGIFLNVALSSYTFFTIEPQHLVNLPIINTFSDLHSNLVSPDYSALQSSSFWVIVFTLAIVASLETLLNIEALEKLDPDKQKADVNRELIAQGAGNITSGLLGGLPLTSVIVRSSANINAGAKSKLSIIIHAALLVLSVLLFPHLLMLIPNSALAVILIMTGYKLAKVSLFKQQLANGIDQFLPFMTTVVVMLLTDLLKGVGAGMLMAVFFIIRDNVNSSFDTYKEEIAGKLHYIIKLPQHLTFFNKGYISNYFSAVEPGSKIIIDGSINKTTNKDVKEALTDFFESASKKNIEIELVKYNLEK